MKVKSIDLGVFMEILAVFQIIIIRIKLNTIFRMQYLEIELIDIESFDIESYVKDYFEITWQINLLVFLSIIFAINGLLLILYGKHTKDSFEIHPFWFVIITVTFTFLYFASEKWRV